MNNKILIGVSCYIIIFNNKPNKITSYIFWIIAMFENHKFLS